MDKDAMKKDSRRRTLVFGLTIALLLAGVATILLLRLQRGPQTVTALDRYRVLVDGASSALDSVGAKLSQRTPLTIPEPKAPEVVKEAGKPKELEGTKAPEEPVSVKLAVLSPGSVAEPPPAPAPPPPPKPELKGIVWSEKTPLAIINDQVLGVGEQVAEMRVTAIRQDSVTFTDSKGSNLVIRLCREEPK